MCVCSCVCMCVCLCVYTSYPHSITQQSSMVPLSICTVRPMSITYICIIVLYNNQFMHRNEHNHMSRGTNRRCAYGGSPFSRQMARQSVCPVFSLAFARGGCGTGCSYGFPLCSQGGRRWRIRASRLWCSVMSGAVVSSIRVQPGRWLQLGYQ